MKKKLNLSNYKIKQVLDGEYGRDGEFVFCLMSFSTKLKVACINATDSWNLMFSFENIIKELKTSWGLSIKALVYTIFGLPIISVLWIAQFIISMKNLILNEMKIKNPKHWTNNLTIDRSYYALRIYRKILKEKSKN